MVGGLGRRRAASSRSAAIALLALAVVLGLVADGWGASSERALTPPNALGGTFDHRLSSSVQNFSSAIGRLVELLGVAGSGLLSLVWARVALSWFSNDITKKVQAKDRARDALIGTLLFVAAITGLFWGLAHWVLTGS